ncbi:signal-transducing histidine kinase [Salinarchaeum sp. Harcht-Bsk1]|uniref:sensor histidine kinase n=1 Tax=Salinarchaeum sp. Harcht-Bsk1 TaxID=1333523 RepID=UPI0003423F21|nr:histidine kinase dimerization/phospho-acceptor domain-containing protein [Salinarchaeum sp. Harcht-Bsk1]AGM99985.1 signal-transducing histidine kinase [Salinarchaeum sp. Harcht-Bsk1]
MSDAGSDGRQYSDRSLAFGASAALFEYAPQPMAAVQGSETPSIQVVNRSYLEQFDGRRVDERDARSFRRRTALSDPERAVVRTAASGSVGCDTVAKRTADGHRQFQVRAIPAPRSDVTAYLQYRDVTARQIRDQQLAVLRRVLRHDLRNDLTVMLGYAQSIAESSDDPESRRDAETIVEAARDLRTVADSAGRMQCVTAPARSKSLREIATTVRRSIVPAFSGRFDVDGTIPPITVDNRIEVALEELCQTVEEHGDATTLELAADEGDDWATITLETNGTLCEQERSALEGRDETQLRHATGIAPWIARWAVRAAGGRLRLDRLDGGGCRIVILVPTIDPATESTTRSASWSDD